MDRLSMKTAFAQACRTGRWLAAALMAVCSLATSTLAQSSWRAAAGAVPAASSAPVVSVSTATDGTQTLIYRFAAPRCTTAADGLADVVLDGLLNAGPVGAPSLPVLPVRIAIPQGRTVKSATVAPGSATLVASGLDVRPVARQAAPGAAAPALARDETLYTSSSPYPAQPCGKWRKARKNGVDFYETTLNPVSYSPTAGEVRFYAEMTVRIELEPAAASAGASGRAPARAAASALSAASLSAPYVSPRMAADVLSLVDNPAVAAAYAPAAQAAVRASSRRAAAASAEVPCSPSESYQYVIVTSEALAPAFEDLAQYRRDGGLTAVVVPVEDIYGKYASPDAAGEIRDFIRDAYATWGAEYVVLGGGTDIIPARSLVVTLEDETGVEIQVPVPSDVYYQCLDGDFDANGNGVYGEPGALDDGGDDPDLYAEVKVGRVPAASTEDVARWLEKVKRYDAAFAPDADDDDEYRGGALFVSELLEGAVGADGELSPSALVDCYGAQLAEQIRAGSAFAGNRAGIETYGFCDATNPAARPPRFLATNLPTLYDKDRDPRYVKGASGLAWTADELLAILNADTVSIVNHVGHSYYTENMRLVFDGSARQLANAKPFFVYSQSCYAGAFDEPDYMAALFTVGLEHGAFGGVWNSREGQYVFGQTGVSNGGYSQYFHRRFWDAVFRLGERSLGGANMLAHEMNAVYVPYYGEMALCFYESNLFGDPAQLFGGPDRTLFFDREAYRPDAAATITYEVVAATNDSVIALLSATDALGAAIELAPRATDVEVELALVSRTDAKVTYAATVNLARYGLSHGDVIAVRLASAPDVRDEAPIDAVAPQITSVEARDPDETSLVVSWGTDEETAGLVLVGTNAPVSEASAVATAAAEDFATSHAVTFEGLETGLYYVRVVAFDKAANTNSLPAATSTTASDYTLAVVSPRETRAFYDMESGDAAWSLAPASTPAHTNCWQVGVPKYGPVGATRCWGTVIDGRYPDGANDALVSPPVTLRANPSVVFRHWYAIEQTPYGRGNLEGADCGMAEICATLPDGSVQEGTLADGTWRNIAEFSGPGVAPSYQGTSSGWTSVRVNLPPDFAGLSVRIRFRFVSDTWRAGLGNPAGWYIDGVSFLDTPASGLILSAAIDDGGDGFLGPGETASATLSSFNRTLADIVPVSAAVSVSASGCAAGDVTVDGSSSTTVSYPSPLAAGAATAASAPVEIQVADTVPIGTVVTLHQVLTDATGAQYASTLLLRVADTCILSGKVLQPTGNPLIGATVSINGSDSDFTARTDDAGAYEIIGLPRGSTARLDVSYGFAGTNDVFTASDVRETRDFTVPVAEIGVSDSAFNIHLLSTDAPARYAFAITNFFTLAGLDGNVGPSADLEYEISGHLDELGRERDWFTLLHDETGSIGPEGTTLVIFELDPQDKDSSYSRTLTLEIRSNAWNEEVVTVDVTLVIDAVVELAPAGAETSDNFYFKDDPKKPLVPANDYDGRLEPGGEIGELRLAVTNLNAYETISRFEGLVQVVGGDVEIMQDDSGNYEDDVLVWRNIAPGGRAWSDDVVNIRWNSGTAAEFLVTGRAYFRDGALFADVQLQFDVAIDVCNAATNAFLKIARRGELSVVTNAVVGARVIATGADGTELRSSRTGEDGAFLLSGLVAGQPYWISFETDRNDTDTVPPPAFLLTPEANPAADGVNGAYLDLLPPYGASYTNAAHLRLSAVRIVDDEDGDGFVDPGEAFGLSLYLGNDSVKPDYPLTATLETPDFERGAAGEFIEITELSGPAFTGSGTDVLFLSGIRARASDTASTGDFQRFLLTVTDASEEARTWYFDFAVPIDARSMVRGSVTNLVAGGVVAGTRIAIASDDGTYYRTVTLSDRYASGDFAFGPLAVGDAGLDLTVSVDSVPTGYACLDKTQRVHLASADIALEPFELVKYGIEASVDGSSASGDGIELSVVEGQSADATITLANPGALDASVDVRIVYNRQPSEILAVDDLSEATAVATLTRALAARIGTDWTGLDPAVFSKSEIEVLFKEGTPVAARDAYLARHGFVAKHHFSTIPASIAVPAAGARARALSSAARADARLLTLPAEDDLVVAVQPSVLCQIANAVPDDEFYPEQWALRNTRQNGGTLGVDIGAEEAWDFAGSFGSRDVLVAVTDSGIDFRHPDLADHVVDFGYNFVSSMYAFYPPDDYSDGDGHGTHVAGIIGAVGNNGLGVSGVNGAVSLLSCRINVPDPFSGATVWATSGEIAQAIEYAYTHGAKVSNNSWGSSEYSSLIDAAIIRAQDYGMLLVCAAGNEALDLDIARSYPAALRRDNVLVVAATDSDGHMAPFSNYSPTLVHLAAPGVGILSTYKGGAYRSMNGTSMAAPFVAGAAAFLYSISPDASYIAVKDALIGGVRKDAELGPFVASSGILDLGTSVRLLGRQWLRFDGYGEKVVLSTNVTLAAGESTTLPVLVNDPPALSAGTYSAYLGLSDANGSSAVPVTLEVLPAGVAQIASAQVLDANGDGYISCGEETTLSITVRNAGSLPFDALTGKLAGPGTISTDEVDYDYVGDGSLSDPGLFDVTLPTGTDKAEYTLSLYDGGQLVAELPVEVALFDGSVVEVTVTDAGEPVADAVVEVIGASAGRARTDADGVASLAVAATASTSPYVIRVLADGAVRATGSYRSLPASETFELEHVSVATAAGATEAAFAITEGAAVPTNVALVATADLSATLAVAPRAKIAVMDDASSGAALVAALGRDGFAVDWYTNNYAIVKNLNEAAGVGSIEYTVRHSWDDATLFGYDAVVALVTGSRGAGRLLVDSELQAYADYIDRGGKVFFAGQTVLARPDNGELAAFLGFGDDACNVTNVASFVARAGDAGLACAPFIDLAAADAFPSASGDYDAVFAAGASSGDVLAAMDDASAPAAKLFRTPETLLGGRAWLWNGLADDWSGEGAALDVLRGLLHGLLVKDKAVDWLALDTSASALDAAGGETNEVALVVNPLRTLPAGEYEALVLVGAETVRRDNPSLLCHTRKNDDLWRAVVSRSGRLPRGGWRNFWRRGSRILGTIWRLNTGW